ncbi:hypothetical protein AB6A23_15940 [Paenibacillus tarimensis]
MQAIWFIINVAFVTALIAMLFSHRALTEAKENGAAAERIGNLQKRRNILAILSIVLFTAMSASFVMNMKLNG